MRLRFTKMHGLGNDFVVLDGVREPIALSPAQLKHIADRHFGVGCDQVLLIEPPTSGDTDFRYRIFNADGGEVEQCGNGARCFALYVYEEGMATSAEIRVETAGGILRLARPVDGRVTVDMGVPEFEPEAIPFLAERRQQRYARDVEGEAVQIGAVSMGNPHAVIQVPDLEQAPVQLLGERIEHHPRFPRRVNVGFMQVLNEHRIRLRVFERGVGETLACGSGACAAVAVGRDQELLAERVRVELPGGELVVSWPGATSSVSMTGPAVRVYEGQIEL